eukprot:679137-Pyramimonas_sp.AAC.1
MSGPTCIGMPATECSKPRSADPSDYGQTSCVKQRLTPATSLMPSCLQSRSAPEAGPAQLEA